MGPQMSSEILTQIFWAKVIRNLGLCTCLTQHLSFSSDHHLSWLLQVCSPAAMGGCISAQRDLNDDAHTASSTYGWVHCWKRWHGCSSWSHSEYSNYRGMRFCTMSSRLISSHLWYPRCVKVPNTAWVIIIRKSHFRGCSIWSLPEYPRSAFLSSVGNIAYCIEENIEDWPTCIHQTVRNCLGLQYTLVYCTAS